jgi:hypothetical protein
LQAGINNSSGTTHNFRFMSFGSQSCQKSYVILDGTFPT